MSVHPAIESPRNGGDAQSLSGIPRIDVAHHDGLLFEDFVVGACLLGLAHVLITVRPTREHVRVSLAGLVTLAPARALQDLCALVFGDHALKLYQQLIFSSLALRRLDKNGLHTVARELFHQQDLIGVLAAQTVRRIDQHRLQLTFRRQVAYTLESGALEARAAKPFVFEDPLPRHVLGELLGEDPQCRRLAGNGAFLLLLGGGDSGVNRGALHGVPPLAWVLHACFVRDREPGARRPVGAWR